jgi:hypothetical protein
MAEAAALLCYRRAETEKAEVTGCSGTTALGNAREAVIVPAYSHALSKLTATSTCG